jgi:uncharacterized protein (DUF1330 family)
MNRPKWDGFVRDITGCPLTQDSENGRSAMTTYLINHMRIPNGIPKPEALVYLENVEATFEPYGGRWLVLDAQVAVMEGGWPGSVVLMDFPDMESAKTWYHSPEYQEILHLRTDNVISDLILVDPVGPGFTSAEWARQIRATIAVGANGQS